MANTPSLTTNIELPEELAYLLLHSLVCEYASIKKNGTPITTPLIPFPGEDGRTIDVNTGLAYPWKAERARNNPNVCLLYSEPKALAEKTKTVALVYGQATVHDADLQANTDRYAKALTRFQAFSQIPSFMLGWGMAGYIARIWITVTPMKILWWPGGNMNAAPKQWLAPRGTQARPSDPPPKPLQNRYKPLTIVPTDWRRDMAYALDRLGPPILTVVDDEGYPVPFRVRSGSLQNGSVRLKLFPTMPAKANGRACVAFHMIGTKNGEMASNENYSFVGEVVGDGAEARFKVERQLPSVSFKRGVKDMLSLGKMIMFGMRKRLETEAARRGQTVPVVRFPE